MRISCVILQRRLPRRSLYEAGNLGEPPVVNFFVIGSCSVAMNELSLRRGTAFSLKRVYGEADN